MDVVRDERRAILFSSHNTQDVEQISDHITFIDRGRIIDASDKETFLDAGGACTSTCRPASRCPRRRAWSRRTTSGRLAVVTTKAYTPELEALLRARRRARARRPAHDARGDLRRQRDAQPAGARGMSGSIVRAADLQGPVPDALDRARRRSSAALVAIAIMPLGRVSAYVGGVSLICVLVILNIFLVMSGVVQERKDKVLLFVLSLPVSTAAVHRRRRWRQRDRVRRAVAGPDASRPSRSIDVSPLPERPAAVLAGGPGLPAALLLRAARRRRWSPTPTGWHATVDHRRQHLDQLLHPVAARRCRRSPRTGQRADRGLDRRHRRRSSALEIGAGAAVALAFAVYVCVAHVADFV